LGDEFVADKLNVVNREKSFCNIALRHVTAEAIGTQQPPVARLSVDHMGVDFWFGVNIAEHAHENTAPGVNGGFFGGDAPTIDKTLDEGVVAGDLLEHTFSKSINARVTDVSDDHLGTDPNHRAHGGSHSGELRVLFHRGGQLATRFQNVGEERLPGLINTGVGTIQAGEMLNRESACNVTTGVTTHSICDNIEVSAH
jgi:hypothetical protein